jgi:hypothetical protein
MLGVAATGQLRGCQSNAAAEQPPATASDHVSHTSEINVDEIRPNPGD